jgi:hypothetical protein
MAGSLGHCKARRALVWLSYAIGFELKTSLANSESTGANKSMLYLLAMRRRISWHVKEVAAKELKVVLHEGELWTSSYTGESIE